MKSSTIVAVTLALLALAAHASPVPTNDVIQGQERFFLKKILKKGIHLKKKIVGGIVGGVILKKKLLTKKFGGGFGKGGRGGHGGFGKGGHGGHGGFGKGGHGGHGGHGGYGKW